MLFHRMVKMLYYVPGSHLLLTLNLNMRNSGEVAKARAGRGEQSHVVSMQPFSAGKTTDAAQVNIRQS
jgi:hypothetical protein